MKMTQKMANNLMDCLAILALCANHFDIDKREVEAYARSTYLKLCNEWEEKKGEKWEVIPSHG